MEQQDDSENIGIVNASPTITTALRSSTVTTAYLYSAEEELLQKAA